MTIFIGVFQQFLIQDPKLSNKIELSKRKVSLKVFSEKSALHDFITTGYIIVFQRFSIITMYYGVVNKLSDRHHKYLRESLRIHVMTPCSIKQYTSFLSTYTTHCIYIMTVSSQHLLSALVNQFELIYQPFGQSNVQTSQESNVPKSS